MPACERPSGQVLRADAELRSETQLTAGSLPLSACGEHKRRHGTTQSNSGPSRTRKLRNRDGLQVVLSLKPSGSRKAPAETAGEASLDLSVGWALSRAVLELMSLRAWAARKQSKHRKFLVSICMSPLWAVISTFLDISTSTTLRGCVFQTYHRCENLARQADPMPSTDSGKSSTDFTELRLTARVSVYETGHPHCCQRELPLLPPGWLSVICSSRISSLSRLGLMCS